MAKTIVVCVLFVAALSAHAAQQAGQVLYVVGEAERVGEDGARRPLARGDAVFEGDLLRTGPRAHLQLALRDDGFVALRPETELRLKRYSDGQALLELLKGTLRSITGAFGLRNRAHYRLEGRQVVLGIRGTDHEATQRDEGFYDRVNEGGTYLEQAAGRVDVAPGQTGFAPRRADGVPILLARTPEFLHASLPAPRGPSSGPPPRERSPLDLRLPDLPAPARFDAPPVGGPASHPGATVTGAGTGPRPAVLPPEPARLPRPNGKGKPD